MSLPVYFVSRGQTPPERLALCGWHSTPEGLLAAPERIGPAAALVFDDRIPLPQRQDALAAAVLDAAERIGAAVIVLDFERDVCPAARGFAESLGKRRRTAAPARFRAGACEPIYCYSPSAQTFPEFLGAARGWIELRPVRETVRYPAAGAPEPREGADHFSGLLQCRYRARQDESALTLELFDTPETFRKRLSLLHGRFDAAIGLRNELEAFGVTCPDR